jgi:hypothetical protein
MTRIKLAIKAKAVDLKRTAGVTGLPNNDMQGLLFNQYNSFGIRFVKPILVNNDGLKLLNEYSSSGTIIPFIAK